MVEGEARVYGLQLSKNKKGRTRTDQGKRKRKIEKNDTPPMMNAETAMGL
jgi:hypothetical protein